MICAPEQARAIAGIVGGTGRVLPATWSNGVYACRYTSRTGDVALSVKELTTRAGTDRYFAGLGASLGVVQSRADIAQGAFVTRDGSFVLRKDTKVLLVDASGLPPQVGEPSAPRWKAAAGIGLAVLACWTGA